MLSPRGKPDGSIFRRDFHRFLAAPFRVPADLRGTFAPFFRASLSPIAIACLRLFTLLPDPLSRVPFFRRRIVDFTFFDADLPYFAIVASVSRVVRFRRDRYSGLRGSASGDGSFPNAPATFLDAGIERSGYFVASSFWAMDRLPALCAVCSPL